MTTGKVLKERRSHRERGRMGSSLTSAAAAPPPAVTPPAGSENHRPGFNASVRSRASDSSLAFSLASRVASSSAISLYGFVNT